VSTETILKRAQLVDPKDLETTPSTLYHEHSKQGEYRVTFQEQDPKKTPKAIEVLSALEGHSRSYAYRPGYELDETDWAALATPLGELLRTRRSRRQLVDRAIDLSTLALLMNAAAGKNGELRRKDGSAISVRTHPSGGALFPLEIYPIVLTGGKDVLPGVYHFDVAPAKLSRLAEGSLRSEARVACMNDGLLDKAAVLIAITGVFPRMRFKYSERGYRHVLLEAGHVGQNLILVGNALGLSVVPLSAFIDRRLEALLDVDGVEESIVHAAVVGYLEEPVNRGTP